MNISGEDSGLKSIFAPFIFDKILKNEAFVQEFGHWEEQLL